MLLNDHFKIQYLHGAADEDIQMRKIEKGVLRYIAGYICCHLRQRSHQFREEMIICLMELVKSQDTEGPEEWTILIDGGGLWNVKEFTC